MSFIIPKQVEWNWNEQNLKKSEFQADLFYESESIQNKSKWNKHNLKPKMEFLPSWFVLCVSAKLICFINHCGR